MLRVFVRASDVRDDVVRIGGAERRHLHTLRLGPGARLVVFDEAGVEREVEITTAGARTVEARVVATRPGARESSLDLVLAPALLKGDKMDLVVEKATELGVRRIAPVTSRHVVGRGARTERWRRIALAAAKQSGRTAVPAVDAPVPLSRLLAGDWRGVRLVAWEDERTTPFTGLPATAAAAIVVLGPEGGFDDAEVAEARAHGFVTVSLAPRVLRAETAALVAVALCQHRWGDLGRPLSSASPVG
jgi:16S rRNA (uracil1498-N3)-methyltransferase